MERAPKSAPVPVAASTITLIEALLERLCYVDDTHPGYTRCRLRDRFVYFDTRGGRIHDLAVIVYINKLTIPPAYIGVWICPYAGDHLQVMGHDARRRKQYRYHADWRAFRDADKYGQLLAFGIMPPWVCGMVTAYLETPGLPYGEMLATVVYLLDVTLVRVDNAAYARGDRSYGLTTLRNRHVEVHGNTVRFQSRGRGGMEHDMSISDPRLACIIRRCVDLPGQKLFQYVDEAGERHAVDFTDVNAYSQEISDVDSTAKDYRTWAGSMLALDLLRGRTPTNVTEARRQVAEVVAAVARHLGNTPAVCCKYYTRPTMVGMFLEDELEALSPTRTYKGPRREGVTLLRFLGHTTGAKDTGEEKLA